MKSLFTLGDLTVMLGVPQHRITYAIRRHNIQPTTRVGQVRVWSKEDAEKVRAAVLKTAANHLALGRCFARGPMA